ncbi:MAG: SUMF1/EgtB/PvdO family nonheme iron enzyme, partial [candidate division WOR-3 bacterium]|nr:SUMF1/EgtB/PvdO family nonheme iron enzyme [candidate division WOR-3 bacterium]
MIWFKRNKLKKWQNKNYNIEPLSSMYERWVERRNKNLKKAVIIIIPILIIIIPLLYFRNTEITKNYNDSKSVTKKEIKQDRLLYLGKNSKGYKEYKNKRDGSTLVYIPAGKFTMGSSGGDDNEEPVHTVYLDGYYISKYEITNKQYKQFCDETNRDYPKDPDFNGMSNYFTAYPDYPVVNVDWYDAKAYCGWAGLKLPTEARWEKGARGTDARKYPWGNSEPNGDKCNLADKSLSKYENWDWIDKTVNDGFAYTSPVGSYKRGQSPYGLMDMAGNVYEWCSDWYGEEYYSSSPSSNPEGPSSGSSRVLRGGSWNFFDYSLRCAHRYR